MIRRLLCALFGHVPRPGVRLDMSITFDCDRCGAYAPGHLGTQHRRRAR